MFHIDGCQQQNHSGSYQQQLTMTFVVVMMFVRLMGLVIVMVLVGAAIIVMVFM